MPALTASRQPEAPLRWFASDAGQALIQSEWPSVHEAVSARPGLPWLAFSAVPRPAVIDQPHGLWLCPADAHWRGDVACDLELPLASESVGAIILQHVEAADVEAWLQECVRVLVPGGRVTVFALNPLSPYRGRWWGEALAAREPVTWRRRMKRAGLVPDPVAQGLGPCWQSRLDATVQRGAGARAAYRLCGEKRHIPLTLKRLPAMRPALGEAA